MNLTDLQNKLKKAKLNGYIVTRNNMFLGQDVRRDENLILQLTGFSGSAGTLLILPQISILFVDGRYELQAPREVKGKNIEVFCTKDISFETWLNQNMPGKIIGFNPWAHSVQWLSRNFTPKLTAVPDFLPLPLSTAAVKTFSHELQFCGQPEKDKVAALAQHLRQQNLDACFMSAADSVSWLFNLRSDALPDTPVFRGMALIDAQENTYIFADGCRQTEHNILSFAELHKYLKKLKKQRLGYVAATTPAAFIGLAEQYGIETIPMQDFCNMHKAQKNSIELNGIRQAHIRDAVAVCKFLYWLDGNWKNKSELDIVKKLHDFRKKNKYYVSESFDTIAGFNANGAIIHYRPETQTNKIFDSDGFLLLDSGAQYLDGTTDITRTVVLGNISPQMADDFTLVLKGHIALTRCIFPAGTCGRQLDILARRYLWLEGKNYNHGTGHGVGCFLNVHEGPQNISSSGNGTALQSGMITSIEPGYYLPEHYGIRIENLVEVCPAAYDNFLCFKNLTLVPIDKRAVNKYLLDDEETAWLNNYHQTVFQTISPYLNTDEKQWLAAACASL